jgi:hypothetical protein
VISSSIGRHEVDGRDGGAPAVVTFPLEILGPTVEGRAAAWSRLDMSRRVLPIQPNDGKPVVQVELASAAWLVQMMIWSRGEAELETIRMIDHRVVNKHYDLTGPDDLGMLLDELVRLLVHDEVPSRRSSSTCPGPRPDDATQPRGVEHS